MQLSCFWPSFHVLHLVLLLILIRNHYYCGICQMVICYFSIIIMPSTFFKDISSRPMCLFNYVFILIWTHGLSFHSIGYKALSILFILCLNCLTLKGNSGWLLCSFELPPSFFAHLIFLVQNIPGSSYTFSAIALKPDISLGNLGSW